VSSRNANAHLLPALPPPNIPISPIPPPFPIPSLPFPIAPPGPFPSLFPYDNHANFFNLDPPVNIADVAFYTLPHLVSRTLLLYYYHHAVSFLFFSSATSTTFSHHLILISHIHVDFFGDPPKIPSVVAVVHVPTPLYPTIEVVFWGQTLGRCDIKEWYQW